MSVGRTLMCSLNLEISVEFTEKQIGSNMSECAVLHIFLLPDHILYILTMAREIGTPPKTGKLRDSSRRDQSQNQSLVSHCLQIWFSIWSCSKRNSSKIHFIVYSPASRRMILFSQGCGWKDIIRSYVLHCSISINDQERYMLLKVLLPELK